MEITLTRFHVCNEQQCANVWLLGFINAGTNPDWNPTTQKCSKDGKLETRCPSICSWLSSKEEYNLSGKDDIVIPQPTTSITFDYPFKDNYIFEFKANTGLGFTREYLIDCICNKYKEMYDEETNTSDAKVLSVEERMKNGGLLNRNETNGKYGIWGHDIDDLWLEGITYNPETNTVRLSIGS